MKKPRLAILQDSEGVSRLSFIPELTHHNILVAQKNGAGGVPLIPFHQLPGWNSPFDLGEVLGQDPDLGIDCTAGFGRRQVRGVAQSPDVVELVVHQSVDIDVGISVGTC